LPIVRHTVMEYFQLIFFVFLSKGY
jgi:hypothetical protein